MIRKLFRIGLKLGLLAALAAVVVKVVQSRQAPAVVPTPSPSGKPSWPPVARESVSPTPSPEPAPAAEAAPTRTPEPAPTPAPTRAPGVPATAVRPLKAIRTQPSVSSAKRWVEPQGEVCPTTHPVKAKMSSKIFHVEGGAIYDRTNPDRCYATPDDAEADGLRASKR